MTALESLKQFASTAKATTSKVVVASVSTATSALTVVNSALDKIIDFNQNFINKHNTQKAES